VTVKLAHEISLPFRLMRTGYGCSLAALLIVFGCETLQNAVADGETRTISLHHMHTNEDLTITYKVNGRYDESALAKLDTLLRDWRQDQSIRMDPHVIDLLWEVHREVAAKEPIWIVCGYRSPATNSMLRKRSSGVAKLSQHMNGKAIDFYIPGVPLDQLRAAGLRAQRGGVGYYPSSGAPFVHLDTGNVRHWPRMPEAQLAAVLAKGQLSSRSASDPRGAAFARGEIQNPARKPGLLAKMFGRNKDKDVDEETDAAAAGEGPENAIGAAQQAAGATERMKSAANQPRTVKLAAVPLPPMRPLKTGTYQVASAASVPVIASPPGDIVGEEASVPRPPAPVGREWATANVSPVRVAQAGNLIQGTNTTANDVINGRGFWQGLPSSEPVEVPQSNNSRVMPAGPTPRRAGADGGTPASVARWPVTDGGANEPLPNALSYASQPTPIATARPLPMGTAATRPAPAVRGDTTVVVKRSEDRLPDTGAKNDEPASALAARKFGSNLVRVGDRFNDPWLRAMIVSPSAQSFMKTTLFGMQDFRDLGQHMLKPTAALDMTFTDDPHAGISTEKFAGSAVTFVSSVKFGTARATAR
jgi:uncharacterized protein YcbK (DUF882 family)